jgi:hypothetical protein
MAPGQQLDCRLRRRRGRGAYPAEADLAEGPTAVTQVRFALRAPAREAAIRLSLEPVP